MTSKQKAYKELIDARHAYDCANQNSPDSMANALNRLRKAQERYEML